MFKTLLNSLTNTSCVPLDQIANQGIKQYLPAILFQIIFFRD